MKSSLTNMASDFQVGGADLPSSLLLQNSSPFKLGLCFKVSLAFHPTTFSSSLVHNSAEVQLFTLSSDTPSILALFSFSFAHPRLLVKASIHEPKWCFHELRLLNLYSWISERLRSRTKASCLVAALQILHEILSRRSGFRTGAKCVPRFATYVCWPIWALCMDPTH